MKPYRQIPGILLSLIQNKDQELYRTAIQVYTKPIEFALILIGIFLNVVWVLISWNILIFIRKGYNNHDPSLHRRDIIRRPGQTV